MLRQYQEDDLQALSTALGQHRKVVYQLPTGGGKTVVAATAATRFLHRNLGRHCWFLVHRRELLNQAFATIRKHDIDCGRIAAGYPQEDFHRMQVASVQTLVRRITNKRIHHPPDMIIVDECHHTTANTYRTIIDEYPKAFVLGLSATPERHDGTGLDNVYNFMVRGPSVQDLVDQGHLANPACYARATEVENVKKITMGEYDKREVEKAANKCIGETITAIKQLAGQRKGIIFCASRAHSRNVAERLSEIGEQARHLDGNTPMPERDHMLAEFARGRVKWITNHSIISEGYDCPDAQIAVLARPTKSLAVYLQMVGRIMRPGPDKMVLDLAGNIIHHGMPAQYRDWILTGDVERGTRAASDPEDARWSCDNCFLVNEATSMTCVACGHPKPATSRAEVLERAERMVEITDVPVHDGPPKGDAFKYAVRNGITDLRGLHKVAKMHGCAPGWAFSVRARIMRILGRAMQQ